LVLVLGGLPVVIVVVVVGGAVSGMGLPNLDFGTYLRASGAYKSDFQEWQTHQYKT
jgi:hypothetical protein